MFKVCMPPSSGPSTSTVGSRVCMSPSSGPSTSIVGSRVFRGKRLWKVKIYGKEKNVIFSSYYRNWVMS